MRDHSTISVTHAAVDLYLSTSVLQINLERHNPINIAEVVKEVLDQFGPLSFQDSSSEAIGYGESGRSIQPIETDEEVVASAMHNAFDTEDPIVHRNGLDETITTVHHSNIDLPASNQVRYDVANNETEATEKMAQTETDDVFLRNRTQLYNPPDERPNANLKLTALIVTLVLVGLVLYLAYTNKIFNQYLPPGWKYKPVPIEEQLNESELKEHSTVIQLNGFYFSKTQIQFSGEFNDDV